MLITGDKGLAGAFNTNLIKGAQRFMAERPGADVKLELIGRKGRDFFRKRGADIAGRAHRAWRPSPLTPIPRPSRARPWRCYRSEEIDAVYLLYQRVQERGGAAG